MLKKFTKWDRRTNLEKEIDSVKVVLDKMKTELDESNSKNLDDQIDSLLKAMSNVEAKSEDYLNMAKALDILCKAKAGVKSKLEEYSEMVKNYKDLCEIKEKQKERNREIKKIAVTSGLAVAQLVLVLKYEKVDVITTKVFSRLPWVKL